MGVLVSLAPHNALSPEKRRDPVSVFRRQISTRRTVRNDYFSIWSKGGPRSLHSLLGVVMEALKPTIDVGSAGQCYLQLPSQVIYARSFAGNVH